MKRCKPGYLASLLERIYEKQRESGFSFARATWSICFFEECGKDTVTARRLEKKILNHKKRSRQARKVKFSAQPKKDWKQSLSRMLGIPYGEILRQAAQHQESLGPHSKDD